MSTIRISGMLPLANDKSEICEHLPTSIYHCYRQQQPLAASLCRCLAHIHTAQKERGSYLWRLSTTAACYLTTTMRFDILRLSTPATGARCEGLKSDGNNIRKAAGLEPNKRRHETQHKTQHVERQTGGQKKQLADNQLQKKVRMQTDEYHRM